MTDLPPFYEPTIWDKIKIGLVLVLLGVLFVGAAYVAAVLLT